MVSVSRHPEEVAEDELWQLVLADRAWFQNYSYGAPTSVKPLTQSFIPSEFSPTQIPRLLGAVDQNFSRLAKLLSAFILQTWADMLVHHRPIPLL